MATNITELVNQLNADRAKINNPSNPSYVIASILVNHFSRPVYSTVFMEDDQLVSAACQAFSPSSIDRDQAKLLLIAHPEELKMNIVGYDIFNLKQRPQEEDLATFQLVLIILVGAFISLEGTSLLVDKLCSHCGIDNPLRGA